jgi:type III pantothenate kinase
VSSGWTGSDLTSSSSANVGCVVAVDLGNSAAKLVILGENERQPKSFRIDQLDWTQQAIQWVRDHASCSFAQWRIASVHRSAAVRLSSAVNEATPSAPISLISRHDIPIELDVEFPDRVGIDRLVGAFAALKSAKPPIVVVDAGSAVTVDYVDASGRFCGGAIMPGLNLQTTSLATGTDALPRLDWQSESTIKIPGRDTLQAIRLGVLTAVAAGIDRLVDQYGELSNSGREMSVLVTGGDANVLSTQLKCVHQVEPNLVCRGLLLLPS